MAQIPVAALNGCSPRVWPIKQGDNLVNTARASKRPDCDVWNLVVGQVAAIETDFGGAKKQRLAQILEFGKIVEAEVRQRADAIVGQISAYHDIDDRKSETNKASRL